MREMHKQRVNNRSIAMNDCLNPLLHRSSLSATERSGSRHMQNEQDSIRESDQQKIICKKKSTLSSPFPPPSKKKKQKRKFSMDPLRTVLQSEQQFEQFVDFVCERQQRDLERFEVPLKFVKEGVLAYPGVKLRKEFLEDCEWFVNERLVVSKEDEDEDEDEEASFFEDEEDDRYKGDLLSITDFKDSILDDEETGVRMVALNVSSSSRFKTIISNSLRVSNLTRERGEREERERKEDVEAKKKKMAHSKKKTAITTVTTIKTKKSSPACAAAALLLSDDAQTKKEEQKEGEEDLQQLMADNELLSVDENVDALVSGQNFAVDLFNSRKSEFMDKKRSFNARADREAYKVVRKFKKEIYEAFRLRSMIERDEIKDDFRISDDRINVRECIEHWIKLREDFLSIELALIERRYFLSDCEASVKYTSLYGIEPTKESASSTATANATATNQLREIQTFNISDSMSSQSGSAFSLHSLVFENEKENEQVEASSADEFPAAEQENGEEEEEQRTVQESIKIQVQEEATEKNMNLRYFNHYVMKYTPRMEYFEIENCLEKILLSASSSAKKETLAETKFSEDKSMVKELILHTDEKHFPENDKTWSSAENLNRCFIRGAESVLKNSFDVIKQFIEKDLLKLDTSSFKIKADFEKAYLSYLQVSLNKVLEAYDESGLDLVRVRSRVTKAMEVETELRHRVEQTCVSTCLEQVLSEAFEQFSLQRTEKFLQELILEEEEEATTINTTATNNKQKKKKKNVVAQLAQKKPRSLADIVPSSSSVVFVDHEKKIKDEEKDVLEQLRGEEMPAIERKEAVPLLATIAAVVVPITSTHAAEEEQEMWQEVKKVRAKNSTTAAATFVQPRDISLSKIKTTTTTTTTAIPKKIPVAKQARISSSTPPLPKSPPPVDVVSAAFQKKRDTTKRALFVDTVKETKPRIIIHDDEEDDEEEAVVAIASKISTGSPVVSPPAALATAAAPIVVEENIVVVKEQVLEVEEEKPTAYVVRNVSEIEQTLCQARAQAQAQQQQQQQFQQQLHHHHQLYQPPLPQMPPPQIIDGQRVFFVPMIMPENGMPPMPYGMHPQALNVNSMAPPPSPSLPVNYAPPTAAEQQAAAAASMYGFYKKPARFQGRAMKYEDDESNGAVSDLSHSGASTDDDTAYLSSHSSSLKSSPPLPKTPPPKQQQMRRQQQQQQKSSKTSMSAAAALLRIPSPRLVEGFSKISSSALESFPRPKFNDCKNGDDFPELIRSNNNNKNNNKFVADDHGNDSNAMVSVRSKSWAEAQMELKGTTLPSLINEKSSSVSAANNNNDRFQQQQQHRQVA